MTTAIYNPKIRSRLKAAYGYPEKAKMSPYERVEAALAHHVPDRVPFDFWAVPEMVDSLKSCSVQEMTRNCFSCWESIAGSSDQRTPDRSRYRLRMALFILPGGVIGAWYQTSFPRTKNMPVSLWQTLLLSQKWKPGNIGRIRVLGLEIHPPPNNRTE